MRIVSSMIIALFIALTGVAHAKPPTVEAYVAVAPPLEITGVTVRGSEVRLTLSPASARAFADATHKNVGHRLALVVGGRVVSTPLVRDPITGGQVSITLHSPEEAAKLARTLQ